MTTYVCVMYVFSKHVHALNLFVISIVTVVFYLYVRVWRLILKKITFTSRPCSHHSLDVLVFTLVKAFVDITEP